MLYSRSCTILCVNQLYSNKDKIKIKTCYVKKNNPIKRGRRPAQTFKKILNYYRIYECLKVDIDNKQFYHVMCLTRYLSLIDTFPMDMKHSENI